MNAISRTRVVIIAMSACLLAGGCVSSQHSGSRQSGGSSSVYVAKNAGDIKKVAVMPFKASTELIGTSVSDLFVTEVLRTGRYELVERSQLGKVLNETELALSGLSVSKAAEVGNMLGADGVIIGTVDEYGKNAESGHAYPVVGVTVRLVDCKTGGIVWNASDAKKARSSDTSLSEHARNVVRGIMAAVSDELRKQTGK